MSAFWGQAFKAVAGVAVMGLFGPVTALAEDAPAPRYTYLGAGYLNADSRCAVKPPGEGLGGFTAEGSLGLFKFVHLIGAYFDGDTDNTNLDVRCTEIGAGASYSLTPSADIILRGYWVHVDSDDVSGSADGFEPELQVRYAVSDRAEIDLGLAYYDMNGDDDGDFDNTETRLALVYDVMPWLAFRVGGVIFDDDRAFEIGLRANLGGNLF